MVTDININLSRNILMFDNIFASYFRYEEKESSSLNHTLAGIWNTRKGAFLELKMPSPFLKLEPNGPLK